MKILKAFLIIGLIGIAGGIILGSLSQQKLESFPLLLHLKHVAFWIVSLCGILTLITSLVLIKTQTKLVYQRFVSIAEYFESEEPKISGLENIGLGKSLDDGGIGAWCTIHYEGFEFVMALKYINVEWVHGNIPCLEVSIEYDNEKIREKKKVFNKNNVTNPSIPAFARKILMALVRRFSHVTVLAKGSNISCILRFKADVKNQDVELCMKLLSNWDWRIIENEQISL